MPNMMAAIRDSIVVEIVTIHKWLDGNAEYVSRSNKGATNSGQDSTQPTGSTVAYDGMDFFLIQNRLVRNFVHYRLKVDSLSDVEKESKPTRKQSRPSTIRVAAGNWHEVGAGHLVRHSTCNRLDDS